jgi:hypothetical protein
MTGASPRPANRDATSYRHDEIVVATQHLPLVLNELGSGVADRLDENLRLGLSRVRLTDLAAAVGRFDAVLSDRDKVAAALGEVPSDQTDVEKVITGLRVSAAAAWDGWMPTIGKNRVVLGGEGTPYTVLKANDVPVPAGRPEPVATDPAGGRNVTVGLLDTPVDRSQSLDGQLDVRGSTLLDEADTYSYREGHATFLAGLVHSYAPKARIRVRGVLDGRDATASAWDVAVELLALVDSGVDVVVMSLGCFTDDSRPPLVLQTAVSMVRDTVLLIAAGGNHGENNGDDDVSAIAPMWPAALDGVVAVGSRNASSSTPSAFTPCTPWMDVLAPGEDLTSTFLRGRVSLGDAAAQEFDGFARWSGTSMSAAIAGAHAATLFRFGDAPRDLMAQLIAGSPGDVVTAHVLRGAQDG